MSKNFSDWDNSAKYIKKTYQSAVAKIGHLEYAKQDIFDDVVELLNDNESKLIPPHPMTEAQMLAIATPVEGSQVFNTTRSELMYYDAVWGWHPVGVIKPYWGYRFYDEMFTIANTPWVYGVISGGNRNFSSATSPIFVQFRCLSLTTGASSTGGSNHNIVGVLLTETNLSLYTTRVLAKNLSTGTERYVFRAGIISNVTGLAIATGCYFVYDEGGVFGTATASPNWLCVTRNGGSPTIVDSGVAVKSEALSQQPQTLKVLVNGATDAKFYIDGVLVATITTTMPTSAVSGGLALGEIMQKQAGTTSREFYVDYTDIKVKFNTFR